MGVLLSIFYFVIVIGILVSIHEFGHFIAARISGMRVDIYSIGMGYRLFGWNKKTGFTFGALPEDYVENGFCDYRLCAFPIGGYCKIAGLVDESMDTDFAKTSPQPWEFRSKNAFLKAFTICAGVLMNFILAILIFAWIAFSQGAYYNPTTEVGYVGDGTVAKKIGFMKGDKILAINDFRTATWEEMIERLAIRDLGSSRKILIQRNGEKMVLKADGNLLVKAVNGTLPMGLSPKNTFILFNDVETIKPAGKAGLKGGDTVVAINGETVGNVSRFKQMIKANKSKAVALTYKRGGDTIIVNVTPDAEGLIGVSISEGFYGARVHKTYGIGESFAIGWDECCQTIKMFFGAFDQIFKGNMSVRQSLGGPIMIAQSAAQQANLGLINFLHFVALLSVSLAIINILPIPALDGGQLILIIYEAIIRREVSLKAKMVIQQIGIYFILGLTVLVFYNDIARILGF